MATNCCSCGRLISYDSRHSASTATTGDGRTQESQALFYSDRRVLCHMCRHSVVRSQAELRWVAQQIMQWMAQLGVNFPDDFRQDPPVRWAARDSFQPQEAYAPPFQYPPFHATHTEGLTVKQDSFSWPFRMRSVPEIQVLYGLPYVHTSKVRIPGGLIDTVYATAVAEGWSCVVMSAQVLVHELLHAWVHLTQYPPLHPTAEEGLCELFAYLWYGSTCGDCWSAMCTAMVTGCMMGDG